jgi:hypothetical protein
MIATEIDLSRPPEEPPPSVRAELLWRIAVRLLREHTEIAAGSVLRCQHCDQPWPCSARRLAELGLRQAAD